MGGAPLQRMRTTESIGPHETQKGAPADNGTQTPKNVFLCFLRGRYWGPIPVKAVLPSLGERSGRSEAGE